MKLTLQTLLNNRYKVTSYLSQGGFGYTYLAMDNLFNEKVCVKELYVSGRSTRGPRQEVISENSKDFSFEYFADRFWDEARQLASFNHPNIVKVKDFFKANGTIYMVMEFVEGETLQSRKLNGGLEDEKSLHHVMSQLLDAVEEVHRHGILHRDIKPENILITKEDKVVLIDFGSARDFEDGKTVAHTTLLTPGYAPIEQYSNRAKRGTYTDIYALGATMYFLLTGQKPIAATDRNLEVLIPPHKINPAVSSQLSSAVMMAMEMKPEDRFQDVGELREVLGKIVKNKLDKSKNITIQNLNNIQNDNTKTLETGIIDKQRFNKKSNASRIYIGIFISLAFVLTLYFLLFGKKKTAVEENSIELNQGTYKDNSGNYSAVLSKAGDVYKLVLKTNFGSNVDYEELKTQGNLLFLLYEDSFMDTLQIEILSENKFKMLGGTHNWYADFPYSYNEIYGLNNNSSVDEQKTENKDIEKEEEKNIGIKWDEKKVEKIVISKLNDFGSFRAYGFQKQSDDDYMVHKIIGNYYVPHKSYNHYYVVSYSKNSKLECHGCAPKISIFEFEKNMNGWFLKNSYIAEIEAGSWGEPPSSTKVIEIGNNIFGVVLEHGFTNQGITIEYTVIYSLIGDRLKEIFELQTSINDSGFSEMPKNDWEAQIKFKKEGSSFYDFNVLKKGKIEGETIDSTLLYRFDGIKYSESRSYR